MHKGVHDIDMKHRGGAFNLEAQGGFLRGGVCKLSWKTQNFNP